MGGTMPRSSQPERDAFLDERRVVMRIALARADGGPFVTSLWFLYKKGAIHFTRRERSEWFAMIPGFCWSLLYTNVR